MLISKMNWMQVEQYLETDDRCILPTGSTEQHAYLSLTVDTILSARLAEEAGELAGVPVYPALPYGLAQQWTAFPGTVTLRVETYLALIRDVLDSIRRAGFRRVLLVNGHGGNAPAQGMLREWMMDNPTAPSNGITGTTRPRPGPRCWRSIRFARMLRGWRIIPGRGWKA